ncbi:hypothetical protein GCM10009799_26090 [Nocardiopsis rhodophaea]|uniref:Uncharacterized protein n=1 Tax=Nocardiopsis rhodophaea TaxID=280238 RepID=A0ABN2T3D1_9ACTN
MRGVNDPVPMSPRLAGKHGYAPAWDVIAGSNCPNFWRFLAFGAAGPRGAREMGTATAPDRHGAGAGENAVRLP